MEAVVGHIELMEEFEGDIGFAFCQRHRLARLLPRAIEGADAKHIRAVPAEGVPVAGGETQVIFHAFPEHQLIRVVVTKRERIRTL